jgi:hypothetical protein
MASPLNHEPEKLETTQPSLFNRTFRDSDGKIVLAQMPNPPLWVWLTATFLQRLLPSGKLQAAAALVAFGALFTWAWLELFDGVNYFRRALGLVVLASIIALRL